MISCFIPLYNNESSILEVLDSICNQSLRFDRIVIIDDGSIDSSVNKVKEFISNHLTIPLELFENNKNIGLSRIRNKILDLSKSDDFIAMIDSDVVLDKNWNFEMKSYLGSNDRILAVSGNLKEKYITSFANKWKNNFMVQNHESISKVEIPFIYGSNVFIRRKSLSPYFRFPDIYLNNSEDIYFSKEINNFGLLGYLSSAKAYHLKFFNSLCLVFKSYYLWTKTEKLGKSLLSSFYQNLLIANHLYSIKSSILFKIINAFIFPLFCIYDIKGAVTR